MPNYVEGLADPLSVDGNMSFAGGMDGQIDPSLLEPIASADLKNMAMNRFGVLTTRKGTAKVGSAAPFAAKIQGLAELDTPTTEQLICVSGGAFKRNAGGTWTAMAGHTADTSAQVCMVQGINTLYIADGVNNLHGWDGTSFTDYGTGPGVGGSNPPICPFIEWFTTRLFAAGNSTDNDTLYISNILEAGAGKWDYTNQTLRIGGGEGDAITGIKGWVGFKLVVFKNNSFYVVEANPSQEFVSDWTVELISPFIGCVSHRSIVQVGNDLYFLSRDGVRSVYRTTVNAQNETSTPISWPMQPFIDRINWTYANKSCATFYDNKYIISVPLDNATEPNYTLVYDTRAQRWTGYWTGWTATVFHISKLANLKHLYFGDTAGKILEWVSDADDDLAASYLDDGSDVASLIKTRAYRFNDPLSPKSGWNVNLEFYRSQATAKLSAILDQGDATVINASFATENIGNQLPLILPFDLVSVGNKKVAEDLASLGEFREIQFQIESTTGKLSLKSLAATAFLNDLPYEEGA